MNTLFANRNYRLLLSASSISNLGDGIAMLALPWLATLLTQDPLLIAAVASAQRLPWLLFSLPAGVWTDNADRRLLMMRADWVRVMLMVFIVLIAMSHNAGTSTQLLSGNAAILTLIFVAFLFGSAEVIRDNAAQTLLPSIVAHSDLERANGQMWSAETITGQFVGPPLAGLLIGSALIIPFGFDALVYAISAALIGLMVLPPRKIQHNQNFWHALREGLTWMRNHSTLLQLAIMLGVINALYIGGMTMLVLYAQEVMRLTAIQYGFLLTCAAIGGVLGGLYAPAVASRLGMRHSLLVALAIFCVVNLIIGVWGSPTWVAMALFLEAGAGMLWNVVTVSYRQRLIPEHLLGRVNSVYRFFGWGGMPLGAMGAGILVTSLTPVFGRIAALHSPYLFAALIFLLLWGFAYWRLKFA